MTAQANLNLSIRIEVGVASALEYKKNAFRLLKRIFDESGGDKRRLYGVLHDAPLYQIFDKLGMSRSDGTNAAEYLIDRGLLKSNADQLLVSITQAGIDELAQAEEYPDKPTTHLPAASTVSHNYHINAWNSQIQAGSTNSVQAVSNVDVQRDSDLVQFVQAVELILASMPTGSEHQAQLQSDVNTLKAQVGAPTPNRDIVNLAGRSIRNVLEGAAGGMISSTASPNLPVLIELAKSLFG